jgi:hypothetical protein
MLIFLRKRMVWPITCLLVLSLLSSQTVLGQNKHPYMITNVPFPFRVDDQQLPPGTYTLTLIGETSLRISGEHEVIIFSTHRVQAAVPVTASKMLFRRYGDIYFLSELWVLGSTNGRQLNRSRTEKRMAQRAESEIAAYKAGNDTHEIGETLCLAEGLQRRHQEIGK